MTLPFSLPDWLPWWATFAVLVPLGLYLVSFLLMPFGVFGLKGRLEAVEARLDEIQGEIRSLSLRLPERVDYEREPMMRPPIPPARAPDARPTETRPADLRPAEPRRFTEPRYPEPYSPELPDRPAPPATRPVIIRRPDVPRDRSEPSFDPR